MAPGYQLVCLSDFFIMLREVTIYAIWDSITKHIQIRRFKIQRVFKSDPCLLKKCCDMECDDLDIDHTIPKSLKLWLNYILLIKM